MIDLFVKKKSVMYVTFVLVFAIVLLLATGFQDAPYRTYVFSFGGFTVAWYSVFILTGIVLAATFAHIELKSHNMDTNILYDGLLFALPIAILGARLHYIIFNWDHVETFLDVFAVWQGGLGIHGAVIATLIFLIFYARKKKTSFWFIVDIVVIGFLIGQVIGRWGNFMNQELYGPPIESQWLINLLPRFIGDQMFINGLYRHPVFLYESLLNLIGLIVILIIRNKKILKTGDVLAFYLIWYGIVRIPIELLRLQSGSHEPLQLNGLSVSITTSILFILSGVVIGVVERILKNKKNQ